MPPTIVPKKRTPLADADAVQALDDAYLIVIGHGPTPGVLSLMAAQTDVETDGYHDMFCFNWGGNKAASGFPLIFQTNTKEMGPDGKTLVVVTPPDPRCNFQAFESAAQGAQEYVRRLQKRPHWWTGLHSESVDGFVDGLKMPPSYMTAEKHSYADALRGRLKRLLPLFEQRIAIGATTPTHSTAEPIPPSIA